jgi:uncharacterized protein involved in outer membrane biogenesis
MASLNGHTAVDVREGVIQNEYWELIAADLATQFPPSLGDDKEGGLTCMVSRFDFKQGVGTVSAMLVDSTLVTVGGEGSIDLGKQTLNLKIKPAPKSPSLVSLAMPLLITGTFKDPTVGPDPLAVAGAVAKGAGALALGAAMPLTLVLPFMSTGSSGEPCPGRSPSLRASQSPRLRSKLPPKPVTVL